MFLEKKYTEKLELVEIKFNLPQVGSKKIEYKSFFDVNDEVFDFVIDENGEILIGIGHYKLNKKSNKLYFAGRLKIKDGLIYYVDNDSGHYSPSEKAMNDVCEVLVEAGVAIKGVNKKYFCSVIG